MYALPVRLFYGVNPKKLNVNYLKFINQEYYDKETNEKLQEGSMKCTKFLEESTNWFILGLPMRRNSFLYEPLKKFILEYYQHGLFAFSETKWLPISFDNVDEDGPQILTMQMLSAGFIIWIVCVVICVIVFLSEILIERISYHYIMNY